MGYIKAEHFTYSYPEQDKPVLDDISFSLNRGEVLLLLGKSGSGKSTLGKAVTGAVPYFYGGTVSGKISIGGTALNKMEHNRRSQTVGMVFQYPEKQLILNKVHREVAFGLENTGVPEETIRRRVFEAMQFTGITPLAGRDIDSLSGGQKQKVAITSALAFFPECIVLDEPISQLDPLAAEEVLNLIRKINEELNITVILIEQRTGKCFELADKVAFIEDGRLCFFGGTHDFLDSPEKRYEPFLPEPVRLFRRLGIEHPPTGMKKSRALLSSIRPGDAPVPAHSAFRGTEKTQPVISLDKVSCGYGGLTVLNRFTASIQKGDCISLLGANGAGKTTLLKTLVGLKQYQGSILLKGMELKKWKQKEIARTIGYVSQNPDDYLTQDTVRDELLFTARHLNVEEPEKAVEKILRILELSEYGGRNPKDLSGGQKQRVAIGSALIASPEVLILDEPTRGIDVPLKQTLADLLRQLNQSGITILLVTHDTEFACMVSNRFWILYQGELLANGTKEEVFSDSLYYTTTIHKLCQNQAPGLFTLEDALRYYSGEEAVR